MVQSMLTGLHGIDIITPGTSTVGYVQDFDTDSFGRFQFALNTASINAFYVRIDFPPKARFRIDMSWLTSLHSARRRLPTRLSWKNSSYSDNCGLAIQSDYKNTKIYWEMTRNDRKYQLLNVNLRLFKSNSLKSRIFSIYKCCFYYDMISKRERRAIYV